MKNKKLISEYSINRKFKNQSFLKIQFQTILNSKLIFKIFI
jgi:hypothetical protein